MAQAIYIPARYTLDELTQAAEILQQAGLNTRHVTVSPSLESFVAPLQPGDLIVVPSIDVFTGIIDLFQSLELIRPLGLSLLSVAEPNLIERLHPPLVQGLLYSSTTLLTLNSRSATLPTEHKEKQVGRPKGTNPPKPKTIEALRKVERLCQEKQLSVAAACRAVGLPRHTYYALHKNLEH